MAMQDRDEADWAEFTCTRVRVLRGLANFEPERHIADELGLSYHTVRTAVSHLKQLTGESDVRGLGRWWQQHRQEWLRWWAKQRGLDDRDTVPVV